MPPCAESWACPRCALGCSVVFQAEDGIRDYKVTGVQTCALPILIRRQFTLRTPSSPTLSAIKKPQADAWGLENSGRLLLGKAAGLVLRSAQQGQDALGQLVGLGDRKSTRLNSSHLVISYAVFCLKKK